MVAVLRQSTERTPFKKRQELEILEGQMRIERESFKNTWGDLGDYILPRRTRFFLDDVNDGSRKDSEIVDSTATLAVRTLQSGMMTGVTSPARPWFKLTIDDDELADDAEVKEYLKDVEKKVRTTFIRSNLYQVLPILYGDMGNFGTGVVFMEEDPDTAVNFQSFLVGQYMVSNDKKGKVRTFFREFQMTVRQIVEMFGMINPLRPQEIMWDNISDQVKTQWQTGNLETQVNIGHWVLPNEDYKVGSPISKYKKFKSIYYEKGISNTNNQSSFSSQYYDKFLSEKGYSYFPVMCVRWEVAGEDTYGTNSPGMVAVGDVKQLQFAEMRIAEALDQKVRPSMIGPTSLKSKKASQMPGDITYLDEREGGKGFRRLFEINFDVREMEAKQDQIRQRISRAFYEDLFLLLANSDRRQITAREVEERHEEKLLALGPVLERINQDLLDPLIENTFEILNNRDELPEVPEVLQGRDYKIEYISIMAQAQKLAGIGNIERLVGFTTQLAQLNPAIVQKLDYEEMVEDYAELVGSPVKHVKTKEQMAELQAIQEQNEADLQESAEAVEMAKTAKTLSETQTNEDTALDQLLGE